MNSSELQKEKYIFQAPSRHPDWVGCWLFGNKERCSVRTWEMCKNRRKKWSTWKDITNYMPNISISTQIIKSKQRLTMINTCNERHVANIVLKVRNTRKLFHCQLQIIKLLIWFIGQYVVKWQSYSSSIWLHIELLAFKSQIFPLSLVSNSLSFNGKFSNIYA